MSNCQTMGFKVNYVSDCECGKLCPRDDFNGFIIKHYKDVRDYFSLDFCRLHQTAQCKPMLKLCNMSTSTSYNADVMMKVIPNKGAHKIIYVECKCGAKSPKGSIIDFIREYHNVSGIIIILVPKKLLGQIQYIIYKLKLHTQFYPYECI